MFTHDAEYFRKCRRAEGIQAREPFSAPKFPRQANEPRRLEQLAWPRNLYGDLASIAELMAESENAIPIADAACSCGYRQERTQNESWTSQDPYGRGFNVTYLGAKTLQEQAEPGAEVEQSV